MIKQSKTKIVRLIGLSIEYTHLGANMRRSIGLFFGSLIVSLITGLPAYGLSTTDKILDKSQQMSCERPMENGWPDGTCELLNLPTRTSGWHRFFSEMPNDGTYYDFEGDIINGEPVFKTRMIERNGEKTIRRMVFKDIQEDSFIWIWEGTKNNGVSWNELWRINYKRK